MSIAGGGYLIKWNLILRVDQQSASWKVFKKLRLCPGPTESESIHYHQEPQKGLIHITLCEATQGTEIPEAHSQAIPRANEWCLSPNTQLSSPARPAVQPRLTGPLLHPSSPSLCFFFNLLTSFSALKCPALALQIPLGLLFYLVLKLSVEWFSEPLSLNCCFPQLQNEEIQDLQSAPGRETAHSTWGSECFDGWVLCGNGSCPGACPRRQLQCMDFRCCY